jgi:hypothetical protein
MIRIHAFVLVSLFEVAILGPILAAVFFIQNRKHKMLCQKASSGHQDAHAAPAGRVPMEHAASTVPAPPAKEPGAKVADTPPYAQVLHEKEGLAAKVKELETRLLEDKKTYESLEKKYAELEEEYSVLYERHIAAKDQARQAHQSNPPDPHAGAA